MTKSLKWRLAKLPTSEEVTKLVNDKIISKEEAREILFNEVEEQEQTLEDAKKEIKFLKELVETLGNKTTIIENIKYIEQPYYTQLWYRPYQVWCGSTTLLTSNSTLCTANSANTLTSTANCSSGTGGSVNFSAI